MKYLILLLASTSLWASEARITPMTSETEIQSLNTTRSQPYDQLLTVQAGPYTPHSIQFTNWNNNTFVYDSSSRSSFMAEMAWAIELFPVGQTSIYFSEGLSYSTMSLHLPAKFAGSTSNQSVTLHLLGLDSRITQAWNGFPVSKIIPFWEGGYQYTFYNQSGTSDLLAGEGAGGNFVAGLGMRYWVNRSSSLNHDFPGRYVALPIFVTAKVNQIFSNGAGFDPADTTFLAGVSVGL